MNEQIRADFDPIQQAINFISSTIDGVVVDHDKYLQGALHTIRALESLQAAHARYAGSESEAKPFDDWPEFHYQGMGCGLEDRGITDRYEAMRYGWDEALDRVAERLADYTSPSPAVPDGMVQVRIDDLRKALGAAQIPPWSSLYKDHPEALKRLAQATHEAILTQATKESDK